MPCIASVVLQRSARSNLNGDGPEGDPAIRRKSRDEVRLDRRFGTQPMVDVNGGESPSPRWREAGERIEQCRRVGSSAARDEHVLAGDDHPAAVNRRRNRTPHPRNRCGALTRREAARGCWSGGGSWIRTRDIPGMNRLLYHLS